VPHVTPDRRAAWAILGAVLRLCFVCLGNICRSPTAEAVMRGLVARAGLQAAIEVDSAGTGDWHLGAPPDPRTRATADRRGLALDHRARLFTAADFDRFDVVLTMDHNNQRDVLRMARTPEDAAKVRLLRSYDPAAPQGAEVPDPYYGGPEGFEQVFDICEAACAALLEALRPRLPAPA
jgi:protein-tyrosine phosphatase